LPVAAIGGIGLDNAASVIQSGALMACAVSAVAGAGDEDSIAWAAKRLSGVVEGALAGEAGRDRRSVASAPATG